MSNYIEVSAQSRTGQSQASRLNIMDMVARDNKTYNLAEVYEQNKYVPAKGVPEGNIDIIKRAIVAFYEQYEIRLNEDTASVDYLTDSTLFGFSTNFDMHSNTGSLAQQAANHKLTDAFKRRVTTGGNKNRVLVYVHN